MTSEAQAYHALGPSHCDACASLVITYQRRPLSQIHQRDDANDDCERNDLLVSSQVFIGAAIAILCSAAVRYDQWFVHRTTKGQRLTSTFGEQNAVWIWRGCLLAAAIFGVCLAAGLINPMTWNE
jgi:hypothetical protein